MNAKDNLLRAIEQAAYLLESASAAPSWLLETLRKSASCADCLAPEAPRDHRPADHFYPH
jgi:hypothetical protein